MISEKSLWPRACTHEDGNHGLVLLGLAALVGDHVNDVAILDGLALSARENLDVVARLVVMPIRSAH